MNTKILTSAQYKKVAFGSLLIVAGSLVWGTLDLTAPPYSQINFYIGMIAIIGGILSAVSIAVDFQSQLNEIKENQKLRIKLQKDARRSEEITKNSKLIEENVPNVKKIDLLLLVIPVLVIVIFFLVISPAYEFEDPTIVKNVSGIYKNPIHLTFHWTVEDQIQVGKLMTLQIIAEDLPYNENMKLKEIELFFNETYINYWIDDEDQRQKLYSTSNIFLLKPDWNKNVFSSEKINFRFIVPVDIPMIFCDYNLNTTCVQIENIIHPAPYDLANRIDTNRMIMALTIVVAGIGLVNVWARLRR